MPYYNGAWLSDEEYAAVTRAVGAGGNALNGRQGGYDPVGNWNVGTIPAGGDARDRGGANPSGGINAGVETDTGSNGLTPRVQQSNEWDTGVGAPNTNNGMDPRWSQPNSGQAAINNYGGGADYNSRLVQPFTPTTRPAAGGGAGGGPARPENQRPGETYEQYLTRFYAAYGQQPPQTARPASGGGGGGGGGGQRPAVAQPSYMPSVKAPAGWNEAGYLRANPDVAAAVRQMQAQGIPYSGYDHYVRDGQRENRPLEQTMGGVSEAEYLARNPDVAAAIGRGQFASAWDHWNQYGKNEVRAGGRGFNDFERANPWAIGMTAAAVQAAQQRPTVPTGPTPEQQRAAQVAGIKPKIVGVDRWGAQLVGFDNVPAGVNLSNEELGRMAQNAGYGAAAVQQGWRDRGGGGRVATEPTREDLWGPGIKPQGMGEAGSDGLLTGKNDLWGTGMKPQITNDAGNKISVDGLMPGKSAMGNVGGDGLMPNKNDLWGTGMQPQIMNNAGDKVGVGYDWGNPTSNSGFDLKQIGVPPEDDEEEKHRRAMLESTSGNRPW